MSDPARKRAVIVRSFNDAGTGESFEAGKTQLIDAGAYANYEAAGLVRAPNADEAEDDASTGSRGSGSTGETARKR